jgi:hypothetical protein
MERQLVRTVAIMVVIAALGGIFLTDRADRVARARRAAVAAAAADSSAAAAANPDSVRFVAAALAVYDADRRSEARPWLRSLPRMAGAGDADPRPPGQGRTYDPGRSFRRGPFSGLTPRLPAPARVMFPDQNVTITAQPVGAPSAVRREQPVFAGGALHLRREAAGRRSPSGSAIPGGFVTR